MKNNYFVSLRMLSFYVATTLLVIFTSTQLHAQCNFTQLGLDIDGEAAGDGSGHSVSFSSDGLTVAIGAGENDGNGNRSGHVRVYKMISGTWTQQGADIDGEAADDYSGKSVSLSSDGSTVAIGAPFNDGNGNASGHVRVYKTISGTWTQQGADIDGEAADNYSGYSVSLSADGSTVAIGAYLNDDNGINSGHIRVYKMISGTWTQQGADIDGEAADDQSGRSLSLSSDGLTVAIGAPSNTSSRIYSGHVRVYKIISGTWTQQGADIDGEAVEDFSGRAVSLSSDGSTVAIGAYLNDGNGNNSGHVRVYKIISGVWTKQGADIDGEAVVDGSGVSISLSSDGLTVAIGAIFNDGNGNNSGHVRVYKMIGGVWTKQGLDIDGEAAGDQSGYSVSLSADGTKLAIGAINNAGNGTNSGHVRVYEVRCLGPELVVKGNNISIVDGAGAAIAADSTYIGATNTSLVQNYKIVNTGVLALTISSIISSGTHASEFVISNAPSSIPAGDSAYFTVTFTPTEVGTRSATITINNNDKDQAVFDFVLGGTQFCTGNSIYTQLGLDIDGEAADDQSGTSISFSSDGLTVALGATYNDGNGSNSGHVRVYKMTSRTWTQQGADIDGEAAGDYSGGTISLSSDGSTVAIGAYANDGNGSISGHVRVYKIISGTWTQQGADIDGEAIYDQSGISLSLSSNGLTVAIGATANDGNGNGSGHVRVYKNISGTWIQQGADIDGEATEDFSGNSVSLSSDGLTVAIGAIRNSGNGINSGHVRVYKMTSGTWTQLGADIDGEAKGDQSGYSVSLSSDGSTVAIGAPYNDGNGIESGHVRVYKMVSGTWTNQGGDIDGEATGDQSGWSVSLSSDGSTVAIGARFNGGNGNNSGQVRVYKMISGTWAQQGADIDGEAAGDLSGYSVSLSADGTKLAIGAPYNAGNGGNSGHLRVYEIGCPAPEIVVEGNNISIVDGAGAAIASDSTYIGATNTSLAQNYKIVNTGTIELTISSIVSSGTHASEFVIGNAPSNISVGDSAYFTVTFSPADVGTRSAIITIINNDKDEAVFDFVLGGTQFCTGNNSVYTQLGLDIDGEAADDYSGLSVSLSSDGLTVAIGAPDNDGNGSKSGHVRVYKNKSGTWTQLGLDIDGEAAGDNSGNSVSLSSDGSTVAIGAPYNDGNGNYGGHVRVYKMISGTWTQLGADIDSEADYDQSGWSVSLSSDGSTVAIGAHLNGGNGSFSGQVRVYKITNGNWTQLGADIDGETADDKSGWSVSLSSDGLTIAIGATENDGNGSKSGHVRVYKMISGTWTQQGADIDGEAAEDYSGRSVSLSSDGSTVAIGASNNDGNGSKSGHVRVYKMISGTWTQQGVDIDGDAVNDYSGGSVSLSSDGSTIAIGAVGNDGNGSNSGRVLVYKNISGTWTQQGADIDGEAGGDLSGYSVSLSADGTKLAIGASDNAGNGSKSGHVRVYEIGCLQCDLNSPLPTIAGTYTSSRVALDGSNVCFCDTLGNLLLAIDTVGSGAVIPDTGVSLEIGNSATTAWNDAGGIITNAAGAAIFNRKWSVTPTTQPTNPVKVKYFFTALEYDSIVARLAPMSTNIMSPEQLEMYELTTNGFGDPHASGASGTILENGSTATLSNWVYTAQGTNHSATYLVNSLYGGGAGVGAGKSVGLIDFTATRQSNLKVYPNPSNGRVTLNWDNIGNSQKEITIVDVQGKIVYKEVITATDGEQFHNLDLSNLSKGIYIIQTNWNGTMGFKKLIVQ